MADKACYLLAGGGSGGHLYPGIAVADELRRRQTDCEIVFVGSDRPIEQSILRPAGFEHHPLPTRSPLEFRRSPWRFLRNNWSAFCQARHILRKKQPQCVIGLGGFASVPAVWMAKRLGIPIVLIEQNAVPGAATRWLARSARHICLTFIEAQQRLGDRLPCVITGNPVRAEIASLVARQRPTSSFHERTLLILGGSQGAESLNDAVVRLLPDLQPSFAGWQIVHQTGAGRAEKVRAAYRDFVRAEVLEFLPNIAERYLAADLVISRAGATTLAELACAGCPSILAPYPFAVDQHQAANASAFVNSQAAVMIQQASSAEETAERLRGPLADLLRDEKRRESMSQAVRRLARPDAAGRVADLIQQCAIQNKPFLRTNV